MCRRAFTLTLNDQLCSCAHWHGEKSADSSALYDTVDISDEELQVTLEVTDAAPSSLSMKCQIGKCQIGRCGGDRASVGHVSLYLLP